MNQAVSVGRQCTQCHATVEPEWLICANCGTQLSPAAVAPEEPRRDSALPSADIADPAFVPPFGGARRPITVNGTDVPSPVASPVSLESLLARGGPSARPPSEPPSEDSHRPVTFVLQEPGPPERSGPAEIERAAPAPEPAPVSPLRDALSDPAFSLASTTLPPTLVVAPERPTSLRIAREDLAEMQRMVDESVRTAIRESGLLPGRSISLTGADAQVAMVTPERGHAGAIGAGILLGGVLLDLIVLNWDTWVKGDAASVVGWLQQTGVIGAAAIAGAGAATAAIAVSRRRRHRRAKASVDRIATKRRR